MYGLLALRSKWARAPRNPAPELAVPARPTGQTALSAIKHLQKFGAPLSRGGYRRRRASRRTDLH
eukprot:15285304-Alexandrium_andersonii.AAC.1